MNLVYDTLRVSMVTEELDDSEVHLIEGLFDVIVFKPGEVITQPNDTRPHNLYILAQGTIEVQICDDESESTLTFLNQGDLAGLITFVGGASSEISATLYAVDETTILSLDQIKIETLVISHPMIAYRIMRGVARSMHSMVKRGNRQSKELSNYINQVIGRY